MTDNLIKENSSDLFQEKLIESIHKEIVIFTFCNNGYMIFVENFINRCAELKTEWKLFVICIDKESFNYLSKNLKYMNCVFLDFKITSNFVYWNQNENWNKIQFTKLDCYQYIIDCVKKNNEIKLKKVVYIDTDIYLYKDFYDDISKHYSDALIYFQNDNKDISNNKKNTLCAGLMIYNLTQDQGGFDYFQYRKYIDSMSGYKNGDQEYLNSLKNKYSCNVLPRDKFPNGVFYTNNCIHENSLLIHYNWMVGYQKLKNMIYNCHIKIKNLHVPTSIIYPPFNKSSTIEEYFFNFFKNKVINKNTKYLSVFWTNVINHNVNCIDTLKNLKLLENQKLFTIIQHADGFGKYNNFIKSSNNKIIVFTGGRYMNEPNNIDLPLIYDDGNYLENIGKQNKLIEKKYLFSFVGANTHPIRKKLLETYKKYPNVYFSLNNWTNKIGKESQDEFIDITLQSKFGLAPRGYGCTSFRLYEIFKLGVVPVYVSDDQFKIPYKELFDFSEICVLVHEKDIPNLKTILENISENQYQNMLDNYQKYKHYFTMDGLCEYILSKID